MDPSRKHVDSSRKSIDPSYSHDHRKVNPEVNYGMQPEANYGMQPEANYGMQPGVNYGMAGQHHQQQQSTTTVVIQQLIQQNNLLVANVTGHREWSTGICECFSDIGNCLFTWCCYPYAICQLAVRTGECCCTPLCVPGSEINLRTRIRTLGGIQGSMCSDCLVVACCGPCAACQESRELTNMGIP